MTGQTVVQLVKLEKLVQLAENGRNVQAFADFFASRMPKSGLL